MSGSVRVDRLLPHPKPSEDVRGHVQRMWHVRRDLRVADRCVQAGGCKFRRIVAVDQIMDDAGVIWLLGPNLVEDLGRLALIGVGFVGRQRRCVQSQPVEHRGLAILGVMEVDLFHRLLVGDGPGVMIKLVAVAIEGRDRGDVVLLTFGLRSRGNGLLYRLSACLQRRRARWIPQWIPMAHRDAPIPHRAARFGFGDRGKPLQGLGIPEGMQGPHGLLECPLDGRPTGNPKVNFA